MSLLSDITSWIYHLGDVSASAAEEIAASGAGLVVVDYSTYADGAPRPYTELELASMRGDSDALVVSYISVGEAEDYRDYWQDDWSNNPPDFLSAANPEWTDNYKVKFWEPEWQEIVFDYVRDIVDSGFNGLYLDIIDSYYYWNDVAPNTGIDYEAEMAGFVADIREVAEARLDQIGAADRNFVVIGQNGEELVLEPEYLAAVDGIAKEDLRFYYPNGNEGSFKPVPEGWYEGSTELLEAAQAAGVEVFVVEYMTEERQSQYADELSQLNDYLSAEGMPLYIAEDRDLTEIYDQPFAPPPVVEEQTPPQEDTPPIVDVTPPNENETPPEDNTPPVDEQPVDQAPVDGGAPVDEAPVNEAPVDETPVNEAPVDEAPVDEAPVNEAPVDETPVDEAPVDETPVNEAPVDEAPVDEAPSVDTPQEAPTDDAPQVPTQGDGDAGDQLDPVADEVDIPEVPEADDQPFVDLYLKGGKSADNLFGLAGNDTIIARGGNDFLDGQEGNDVLKAGRGMDDLFGGDGNDSLYGGGSHDFLSGGDGHDRLFGGKGHDELSGGAGDDVMSGGAGWDLYFFDQASGNDRITDFEVGKDKLVLEDNPLEIAENGNGLMILLAEGTSVQLDGISFEDLEDIEEDIFF